MMVVVAFVQHLSQSINQFSQFSQFSQPGSVRASE